MSVLRLFHPIGGSAIAISKFNSEFGETLVKDIRPSQIENYQQRRLNEGAAPATVDREVGEVKTMVNKAENDGMVTAKSVMLFKKVLKKNSNARNMILPPDKFKALIENAPPHLLPILAAGFYSGMRKGEILSLTWEKVDLDKIASLNSKQQIRKIKSPALYP